MDFIGLNFTWNGFKKIKIFNAGCSFLLLLYLVDHETGDISSKVNFKLLKQNNKKPISYLICNELQLGIYFSYKETNSSNTWHI